MIKKICCILILLTFTMVANANRVNSPIGEWVTISDKTHDKSGIVKIYQNDGKLYGRILKVFPGENRSPSDTCDLCPGKFKNKPIQGLVFLWDFSQTARNAWTDGQILDPKNGKIYKGSIKLVDDGNKLELRGYWGIFFRTQTWIRAK